MITARLNKHGQSQAFDSCSILPEVKREAGEVGYARHRGEFLMPGSVFTYRIKLLSYQVPDVYRVPDVAKINRSLTITLAILCISLVSSPYERTPHVTLRSCPEFQRSKNPRKLRRNTHSLWRSSDPCRIYFVVHILTMPEINCLQLATPQQ
jgi:hypothetical protein